jgi:hypothetical protein
MYDNIDWMHKIIDRCEFIMNKKDFLLSFAKISNMLNKYLTLSIKSSKNQRFKKNLNRIIKKVRIKLELET